MGKINRIIPFGMWPANWGLAGTRREKAMAEYYWEGEDLAYHLLDVDYPDTHNRIMDKGYRTAKLNLDYRYHKIGEFDYGLGLIENDIKLTELDREREAAKYLNRFGKLSAEELEYKLFDLSYEVKDTESYKREKLKLDIRFGHKTQKEADYYLLDLKHEDHDSPEYQKEKLVLQFKHGEITEKQLEKETANLDQVPWFDFMGADKQISRETVRAAVELDWNDYFVEYLEEQGWTGATDNEIVDKWFEHMMKEMLHIYNDEVTDNGEADPMPMAGQTKTENGLREYR